MLEKMDTIITDTEMENYYSANSQSFIPWITILLKPCLLSFLLKHLDLSRIRMPGTFK